MYYDWEECPSIFGQDILKWCKACNSSFNTGERCTCRYERIYPDPRTIPVEFLTDELKEKKAILLREDELNNERKRIDLINQGIATDKWRFKRNLRKLTERLFKTALINNLSKLKTIGELNLKGFNGGRKVFNSTNKFVMTNNKYTLIVFTIKPLKRLSIKSLISRVELIE